MIIDSLEKAAASAPNDIAIVDDKGSYTFAQVAALAAGVAAKLRADTQKSTVAILLPAGVGFVAAFHGTLLAGKAVVPINFLLGAKEIAHCLADSGVDTVISSQTLVEKLLTSLPGAEAIVARAMKGELKLVDVATIPPASPNAERRTPNTNDLAVLMYTSGTSGLPKGVRLTYANLQSDVDAAIKHAGLESKHIFLGVVPLFHAFGMTAMMLAPMQLQTKVVHIGRFSPVAALNAIREHKVSLLFGVPSMFAAIARLKDAKAEDFAQMYAILSGGEPLPSNVRELFLHRFNTPLYEGYGLTETSPIISLNTPQQAKVGSVGRPLPTAQIKIANPETGSALPPNTEGEIQVKGPFVFSGYHNLPDATAAAMTPDGFFRTGDLGHLDSDGYLFITGRLKDLIISAGEKAHPREIEEVLLKHPAVAQAAVVAKKDDSRGEVPAAFIVLKEGHAADSNELRSFARDQGLAGWKCPKEIRFKKELPMSPTGKVLKRELAKELIA